MKLVKINIDYINRIRDKGMSVNEFVCQSLGIPKRQGIPTMEGIPKKEKEGIPIKEGIPKVYPKSKPNYDLSPPKLYCHKCINRTQTNYCKVHNKNVFMFECSECKEYKE